MRNIISNSTSHSKVRTLVLSALIIAANPVLAAEDNFSGESKSTVSKYQGISTATFESLSFKPKRTAPAKVEAMNITKIPAEILAKIKSISVKPGVVIKAGGILAKLECTDYLARLTSAQSILNQTQQQLSYESKELARAIKVAHKSSLSESEIERRQTVVNNLTFNLDANKANRDIAKKNVNRCIIKAPFEGLVSNRIANVGEMLSPGSPILELVQLNNSEVSASISISNLDSFNNAENYNFIANKKTYPLKSRNLFDYIANNSSSQNARFTFKNNTATIGSTGRLEWQAPKFHLPAYLLSKRGNTDGVFVERNGKAVFIQVEDAEEGRPFIVELERNDKVVLDGRHALSINQILTLKKATVADKD